MSRFKHLRLVLSLLTLLQLANPTSVIAAAPQNSPDSAQSIEGKRGWPSAPETVTKLIVKYETGISATDATGAPTGDAELKAYALKNSKALGFGFRSVELGKSVTIEEAKAAAAELQALPSVASAEPDTIMHMTEESLKPSAIQTSATWGLDRIDQTSLPLDGRYSYLTSGSGVKAYIIDTGIYSAHSEFTGRMQAGYSVIGTSTDTEDCQGHGTHVAGTVGGRTYGVAKDVTLIPVRVLGCDGSGATSGIISAINWVINNHTLGQPAVANLSLGGGYNYSLNVAVNNLVADGVTVAVASGNDGAGACNYSPASADAAITVNASTSVDDDASFSNYGPCTDIYAPGESITSAAITGTSATRVLSGTSMATPHVAGAAARILSAYPNASPSSVWAMMSDQATYANFVPQDPTDAKLLLHLGLESVPAAVTITNALPSTNSIFVTWSLTNDESLTHLPPLGYRVSAYLSSSGGSPVATCSASAYSTSCNLTSLTTGTVYYLAVVSTNMLGDGLSPSQRRAVSVGNVVTPPGRWAALSAGSIETCGITKITAKLYCWGRAKQGMNIGDVRNSEPTLISTPAVAISAVSTGFIHNCLTTSDKDLYCWGDNSYGELGNGTTVNSTTPVKVSVFNKNVAQFSVGSYGTCAVTTSGAAYCWGSSTYGQVGDGSTTNRTVPTQVSGLTTGVKQVSAGGTFNCALLTSGSVKCWGLNSFGSLGNGTTTNSYTPVSVSTISTAANIATGMEFGCAILADKSVKCWGRNEYGQLGLGYTSDSVVTPISPSANATGVLQLSTAMYSMCFKTSSAIYCSGYNSSWQLGTGASSNANVLTPTAVVGVSEGVTSVTSGNDHTCALMDTGSGYCWGGNGFGQLGLGTISTDSVTVPNLILNPVTEPDSPLNPAATISSRTITMTWTTPLSNGRSPITGYKVNAYESESSTDVLASCTSTTLTCALSSLINGTSYAIEVLAQNAIGWSAPTTRIIAIPSTTPTTPTDLVAQGHSGNVTLTWTTPSDSGGAAISGYRVQVFATSIATTALQTIEISGADNTSALVASLTNGTAYFFSVAAKNSVGYSAPTTSRATATPLGEFSVTPEITVSGVRAVGQTLTAVTGTWIPTPKFIYQWIRGTTPIAGAIAATYKPVAADLGNVISLRIQATLLGLTTIDRTISTGEAIRTAFTKAPLPIISGKFSSGQTLTVNTGTWTPIVTSPSTFNLGIKWLANDVEIEGATSSTLLLGAAQVGKVIKVRVTATQQNYATTILYSAPTTLILGQNLSTTPVPTISGSAVIGQTLTANAGTWDSDVEFTYAWKRGAVLLSTLQTYVVDALDRGSAITVSVTGTKFGYTPITKVSAATAVVTGAFNSTITPTITGTPAVGAVLTAVPGVWSPVATFAYQWLRDGVAISGATKNTFTLTAADLGKKISVRVTGSAASTAAASTTSEPTAAIKAAFTKVNLPTITGTAKIGQTLSSSIVAWSPVASFTIQWFANGTAIDGALSNQLNLLPEHVGKAITVSYTGTSTGYAVTTALSKATSVVAAGTFASTSVPTISGSLLIGETLTANVGSWDEGVSFTYSWKRGKTVVGTNSTYVLTDADRSATLTVAVTGSKTGFTTATLTSVATGKVGGPFGSAPTPTISGTLTVGNTLTALPGAWSPAPAFQYQWKRDGSNISGATSSTYKLVAADYNTKISVSVTGVLTGYAATTKTSSTDSISAVSAGTLTLTAAPAITGTLKVGQTLSIKLPTWNPSATPISYQWKAGGSDIAGATGSTFVVTDGVAGSAISVTVTSSLYGYQNASATSAARTDWAWTTTTITYYADSFFANCAYYGYSSWQNINGTFDPCDLYYDRSVSLYSPGYGRTMWILSYVSIPTSARKVQLSFNGAWSTAMFYFGFSDSYGNVGSFYSSFPYGYTAGVLTSNWSTNIIGGRAYFVIASETWGFLYFDTITVRYESL